MNPLDPAGADAGRRPASKRRRLTTLRTPGRHDLSGYLWSAAGVLAVTWTLREVIPNVNHTTVALTYLLVVLLSASARGLGPAILASVGGVICFNYFFLPPAGSFTIADPQNWVALTAFLITAVIASQLSSAARSRARDAERRREEVWKLYQLSRAVIIIPDAESAISSVAWQVLDVFGAAFCSVLVPAPSGSPSPDAGIQNSSQVQRSSPNAGLPTPTLQRATFSAQPSTFNLQPSTPLGWTQLAAATADPAHRPATLSKETLDRVFSSGEMESLDAGEFGFPGNELTCAPLNVGVRRVGVLVLVTPALERGTIEAVAGLVAVALERARFLREASRSEALRQSDELKSALLASVSHALRTPLTSIRAAVDNLLRHDLTSGRETLGEDTLREFHIIISEEVGRLSRLVNNLLEMARIEAGELHLVKEWTLLAEVFGNVLERCSPVLANHVTTAHVDDKMPLVRIDSRLIAEALVNIVENAAKYSPAGAAINLEGRMKSGDLLISVADTGPGIAPEDIDRVFDKFYRSPSVAQAAGGTGMGLAIARGIILAHGGRVWAESPGRQGTIVTLAIPAEWKVAESAESPEPVDSPESVRPAESPNLAQSHESIQSADSVESTESSESARAE